MSLLFTHAQGKLFKLTQFVSKVSKPLSHVNLVKFNPIALRKAKLHRVLAVLSAIGLTDEQEMQNGLPV